MTRHSKVGAEMNFFFGSNGRCALRASQNVPVDRRRDAWHPSLASAAMTAADAATLKDGDLNHRAMPNLDQGDVDALASAVAPMLAEDDALRAWCSASPAIVRRRASVGTFLGPPDAPFPSPPSSPRTARVNVERFLRADRGDLVKATKRLRDTLRWRRDVRPETKMCGACLNADLRSHYMQHCGWDRRGRALVYSDIGMARDKSPASNAEHCMQVLELLEPSLAPFPDDQYIWVVDFHKFSVADMNPKVAGACLALFGRHYPERLGGMIMVGAPMLFNGLYRAVAAFADPVTVKKVRFVRGPDGRGGGKPWDVVMSEFFDEETKRWLEDEMRENRTRWKDIARAKSWLAATAVGDGTVHGYQRAEEARRRDARGDVKSARAEAEAQDADADTEAAATRVRGDAAHMVRSPTGHDIRGCASFVRSEACRRARRAARAHAPRGVAARGAVRDAVRVAPHDSDDDEFFDATECDATCDVTCSVCTVNA